MTTTQVGPKTFVRRESLGRVGVEASETLAGTITTTELDLGDQPLGMGGGSDSGIDIVGISDVRVSTTPTRPQLKIMNPDCPVRYIPIHVW